MPFSLFLPLSPSSRPLSLSSPLFSPLTPRPVRPFSPPFRPPFLHFFPCSAPSSPCSFHCSSFLLLLRSLLLLLPCSCVVLVMSYADKCRNPLIHGFLFFSRLLDASSHLYNRVCPSVRPSVRPSVFFKSRKSTNLTSLTSLQI